MCPFRFGAKKPVKGRFGGGQVVFWSPKKPRWFHPQNRPSNPPWFQPPEAVLKAPCQRVGSSSPDVFRRDEASDCHVGLQKRPGVVVVWEVWRQIGSPTWQSQVVSGIGFMGLACRPIRPLWPQPARPFRRDARLRHRGQMPERPSMAFNMTPKLGGSSQ